VACAVIFNYKYYYEFLFSAGVRGFSITVTTTNIFSLWRARLFLISTSTTSICPGGVRGYF